MRKLWLGLALALLLVACPRSEEVGSPAPAARWDAPNARWDDPATLWGP